VEPVGACLVSKALDRVIERSLAKALSVGWRHVKWYPVTLTKRNERVRASFSSFLRVKDESARYLLVQNLHRPDFYGPIGGTHKYFVSRAQPYLDRIEYTPDYAISSTDTKRDLRGFFSRKHTASFLQWFANNRDAVRESERECLRRELKEELTDENDIALPDDIQLDEVDFAPVRSFLEKSRLGSGELNLRLFAIFDIVPDSRSARILHDYLVELTHECLVWADADDIDFGRTRSGIAVGHVAQLFIRDGLSRPDFPHYRR